ncbi:hypothetical protein CKO51_14570 [Rhodopirellula sp. SM50]|nr:hypothetical protein CKO51_14570 [Rhodopirellula sp. SM50]
MLETLIRTFRLVSWRTRAFCWSIRGARLQPKVNIGARCRMDYPHGIWLGTRVTLEDDVWLKLVNQQAKLDVGAFTFFGRGTELDVSQRVSIGSNVLIAPRVFITDHSHNSRRGLPINQQGCNSQAVSIGNDVWIGTGATILSGVTIGDGAVIGAGAVVRSHVPDHEIWAGVPARRIGER